MNFRKDEIPQMIGLIAADIRGSWADNVVFRIACIRELYQILGQECPEIDIEAVTFDGRWFKGWCGPYGGSENPDFYSEDALRYLTWVLENPPWEENEM